MMSLFPRTETERGTMDTGKLKEAINNSGYKRGYIAEKLGMSEASFSQRLSGDVEWKLKEAQKLSDLLKLSTGQRNAIFFGKDVAK